jgi:CRISPR-associated endonuclease/helicase Cas3
LKDAGRWRGYQDFQQQASTLGARALLIAGCGAGKTLAAWIWAAAQLDTHRASRVLFLYPTRATATEGFRDYVSWAGPEEAALSTGTARYDLDGLLSNYASPNDARRDGDYTVDERLFALAYWNRRVFSATVDSFIACMTNRYAALCLLPLLVDSIVVVDEVHSFDKSMFRSLERMLAEFDVPVLCMTASLPSQRRRFLVETRGLELYPPDPIAFPDLEREANAPRYQVHASSEEAALALVCDAVQNQHQRVMWVVNTVKRCQHIARRLARALDDDIEAPVRVACYHSRFKLEHRKQLHAQVIDTFKRAPGDPAAQRVGRVLVTSQVCEMSLDLDADVLVTELAPIPALIQRMGRCCRHLEAGRPPGQIYAYPPDGYPGGGDRAAAPYTARDLDQGADFVRRLAGQPPASQARLADLLEQLVPEDEGLRPSRRTAFPDSGPYAMARQDSFRDENDFVVDAILDADVPAWQAARAGRLPTDGFVVPVPGRHALSDDRLGAFLSRAPADRYHRFLGFQEEVSVDAQPRP